MNPLYWLELRIRSREKRLWVISALFLVTLLLVMGTMLLQFLNVFKVCAREINPADIGSGISVASLICHAALLCILAPLATAGRIAQEREQRTLAALVNSPTSASRIAVGKLLGSWTFVVWLGALVLPFLYTASLWGGISWWVASMGFAANMLAGFTLAAVSLGLSGLFGRTLTAYLVTGAFLFVWLAVLPVLGTMSVGIARQVQSEWVESVLYCTLYHNPFYVLGVLSFPGIEMDVAKVSRHVAFAAVVWLALGLLGFRLAVSGLKREVR